MIKRTSPFKTKERKLESRAAASLTGAEVSYAPFDLPLPAEAFHGRLADRLVRFLATAVLVLSVGALGVLLSRAFQKETEMARYRWAIQDLAGALRVMCPLAMAKSRVVQMRIDPAQGTFQLTSVQGGRRAYELLERTFWLPSGLHIVADTPKALIAFPTGEMSPGSIRVAAPSHSKLFRITTTGEGIVRLYEEPLL